jgi:hypothetical protein
MQIQTRDWSLVLRYYVIMYGVHNLVSLQGLAMYSEMK